MNINNPQRDIAFNKDFVSPHPDKKTATPPGISSQLPLPQSQDPAKPAGHPITAFKIPPSSEKPIATKLDEVDKMVLKETDKEAIANRDGVMWECLERKKGPGDGYIYVFRYRDEFRDSYKANKMIMDIFPATEPPAEDVDIERGFDESKTGQIFRDLGYKFTKNDSETFLELPDKAELVSRWKELRSKWTEEPPLEELDIKYSIGVASDEEFFQMFCKHDALLSTGKEFVHDHFYHVKRVLLCKLDTQGNWAAKKKARVEGLKQFGEEINQVRKWVNDVLEGKIPFPGKFGENEKETFARIQRNLVHADVFTGIFADIYSATFPERDSPISRLNLKQMERVPIESLFQYNDYFAKRFPSKEGDIDMFWLWDRLKEIIPDLRSK